MKERKRIGILFGGCSSEHEVSLKSAASIINHMDREKYELMRIGITKEGKWLLYQGETEKILDGTWEQDESCVPAVISPDRSVGGICCGEKEGSKVYPLDAALPVLHGRAGEDGTVQGLLELAGIPVIGCGTMSSAICMDKDMSHRLAGSIGVRVPGSLVLERKDQLDKAYDWAERTGYPVFVKPATEGSSIGISKVYEQSDLAAAVDQAFRYDTKVILEETIEGFEVGCALLGGDKLVLGAVDEIETPTGFFDFEEKYTQEHSRIYVPARIPEEKAREIQETARRIYRILGCKGFARVDLFLTPKGEIVFNEVNTIPGFTPYSRYPKMLDQVGISYKEMVQRMIETEVGA
ncbi:D-alanine--D-serine ligase VanG [Clostridiales bacterium]|nr:D-alanine--D-serine ligase VanG [Clostridiales bacterium]